MRLRRVTAASPESSHSAEHRPTVGVERHGRLVPLGSAVRQWLEGGGGPSRELLSAADDMLLFLGGGPALRAEADRVLDAVGDEDFGMVQPSPGLPFAPVSFRDCALWERHMIDAARGVLRLTAPRLSRLVAGYERITGRVFPRLRPGALWYEQPVYYRGDPLTVVADGELLRWPAYAQALDYELEIAVVLAQPLGDVGPEQALAAVGGFVVLNDVSARDLQYREMTEGRLGVPRTKDFATALGATVVTADEVLPELHRLTGLVRVNGEVWSRGTSADMRHDLGEVLAFISRGQGLHPGDLIGLGTLPGCSGVELDRWLSPGDVVECEITQLGTVRNPVGQPEPWRQCGPVHRADWTVVCRREMDRAPARLEPLPWTPSPAPPLTGALAPNTALDEVHRWEIPGGLGPEDVAVDDAGRVYAGLRDGRVLRWSGDSTGPEVVVDTHAGPAGLEFDPQGRLVICDMLRGLLRADAAGEVQVLADSYHGRRLGMVNNAAIGADGTIYFSDSSTRWPAADYRRDLLEHRPTGRLFARRPDGRLDLLLDDLAFANGVSLGPDEDYLLIAETGRYRVLRYELTGPAAGTARVVTDNLPGFPDNLSARGDGTYWLGLPSPRLPMLDRLLPHPRLRAALGRGPQRLQPAPARYGLLVLLDGEGRLLDSLHGPAGRFVQTTGAVEADGWLYVSSLEEAAVGRVRAPRAAGR